MELLLMETYISSYPGLLVANTRLIYFNYEMVIYTVWHVLNKK